MSAYRVPVVLLVFNRPEKLRRLLAVLAEVRPRTLLVVADGPRSDNADDVARCRDVRELVADVDWPCEIVRNYSEVNLGCDPRVVSGIDWAFEHVEEAILLEDDLVPDPSFFGWCAEMLSRYRGVPSVLQVSGRNELGRWEQDGNDHYLVWRGSHLGCATWRRAWKAACEIALPGEPTVLNEQLASVGIDPLVGEHFEMLRRQAGASNAWDTRWSLQRALLGGLSVVSSVNLVAHRGFDEEATHCRNAGDLRGLVPVGRAPEPTGVRKHRPNNDLDRRSLLIELMNTFRDPLILRRLSNATRLVVDPQLRHHLAPFAMPVESLAALEHLERQGVTSPMFDTLLRTMREIAAGSPTLP